MQHDLQDMMQDLVGIVRREDEMQQALDEHRGSCSERAEHVAVAGNREYNPGWHTALDLHNLLTVSEAITRAALERKESRGAHFRDDYPAQGRSLRQLQPRRPQRHRRRRCKSRASRFPPCPPS